MGKSRGTRLCDLPLWRQRQIKASRGNRGPENAAKKRERQEIEREFRDQARRAKRIEGAAPRRALAQARAALRRRARAEQRERLQSVGLSKKTWPKERPQAASARAAAPPLAPGFVPILPPNPWHFSLNSLARPAHEEAVGN